MVKTLIRRDDALYRQIVLHFEEQIMQGQLKAGDKLPPTTRLAEMFGVTTDTIQQSLKLLASRGFISRTPGRGTFVRKGVHSQALALIFKRDVFTNEDVSFYVGFFNDLVTLAESESWNCRYFLVSENLFPESAANEKGLLDLKKALNNGEIRAVVEFCSNPTVRSYLSGECPVPISFSEVSVDLRDFLFQGLDYLRGRGFRRIGVLGFEMLRFDLGETLNEYEFSKDMTLSFREAGHPKKQEGYRLAAEMFAQANPPEALLIANDRLFAGAWYYLLEKGIRVPEDVAVLTHTNKGREPMSHIPLTRLEVDPFSLAREVYKEITAKIDGVKYAIQPVRATLVAGKSCGE